MRILQAYPHAPGLSRSFSELDSLARFLTTAEQEMIEQCIKKERIIREEIRKLHQFRSMGVRTFDEIETYTKESTRRVANRKESSGMLDVKAKRVLTNICSEQIPQEGKRLQLESKGYASNTIESEQSSASQADNNTVLDSQQTEAAASFNESVDNTDAFQDLLNEDEQRICQICNLTPVEYLVIKENLIKHAVHKNGDISKGQAAALFTVEMSVLDSIMEFFVKCEWIKPSSNEIPKSEQAPPSPRVITENPTS